MEFLITVVVPIYNVEKYLDRCVQSIVNQTYKNLEIILVDDGSPDGCPKMCDDWAKRDDRIKVIHKENAGLGMARNTGIKNAKGDYICFFDSDDYISEDTIELCVNEINLYCPDIVCFGYRKVNSKGIIKDATFNIEKKLYEGSEVQDVFLPKLIIGEYGNILFSAWCMLYSLQMINSNDFAFVSERQIISEDVYSLTYLFRFANRVSVLPRALYFHCDNPSSLTQSYRRDRLEKIYDFYNSINMLIKECNYNVLMSIAIAKVFVSFIVAALKQVVRSNSSKEDIYTILYDTMRNEKFRQSLKMMRYCKNGIKQKILFFLFKIKAISLCKLLLKNYR